MALTKSFGDGEKLQSHLRTFKAGVQAEQDKTFYELAGSRLAGKEPTLIVTLSIRRPTLSNPTPYLPDPLLDRTSQGTP